MSFKWMLNTSLTKRHHITFAPGHRDFSPGGIGETNSNGDVIAVFPNVLTGEPGRNTFAARLAFDSVDESNGDGAHFFLMMHADLETLDPKSPKYLHYTGHGAAIGPMWGQPNRAYIESWGPSQAPGGPKGANVLINGSASPVLVDSKWLYNLSMSSMLSGDGRKYARLMIGPEGQQPWDTGDIEDNNPDVNMYLPHMILGYIFKKKPNASPSMAMRMENARLAYMPHDLSPMPDQRVGANL